MAKKKTASKKKTQGRKAKSSGARKRLTPRKEARGLAAGEIALGLEAREVAPLVEEVEEAGGAPIGAYREPLSGRAILVASLPLKSVQPTPFQRDISPTHAKRLAQKIEESGSFLDPVIVVRGDDGSLWTPNGRHRLQAAKLLGLRQITALVSPDEELAYRILALNTEKAHNLRDRALEVTRMAYDLAELRPRAKEKDFAAEFEGPELLTLGILYDEDKRFSGGAYRSFLRKVDRFSSRTLPASLREREDHAARLEAVDAQVKKIIEKLKARGFKSPYLRPYVVARINPVRFHRPKKNETRPPMTMAAALTRMLNAAKRFDVDSVKSNELALVAAMSGGEE